MIHDDPTTPARQTARRCPICDRVCQDDAAARQFLPFCSERCRQVDLMRWIDGRYAIVDELRLDEDDVSLDGESL